MRNPERIKVILQEIDAIWHKYPDMRLGQLIGNVLEGPNLYYVEDEGLVNALKDAYNGAKEHYILDIEHPEHAVKVVTILQEVLPFPKRRTINM